mgnify:CR=1 FL=1|tara:strand:- start:3779 stop:4000 length:222 start_codon:yes stop_codon:yes gene_type:complete
MKTQYRVINRKNRRQYILNAKEVAKFFKRQNIRDYAVSVIKSKKQIINNIIAFLIISVVAIGLLMLGAMMDKL